ncbi:MAG TPA: LysM peptidoglycan-binding domain-containing protein [Oscillospiraceae bacterium]|nr:LysM peptidoglycan-binding domain-containing protein [Oscillospiraceae bacterium]
MDSAEAVTDCTFGERAPSGTKRMPLIIYYAGGDETLWQIAKKYRSAPELIAEENGLTDSIPAAGTALLIPR